MMSYDMKAVGIFIESDLRWRFFSRMHEALCEFGYEVVYITTCITVYENFKDKFNIYLLKKDSGFYAKNIVEEIPYHSLEYKLGEFDEKNESFIINNFENQIKNLYDEYKFLYFFIYNGTTILSLCAKIFSDKYNICSIFFELANIPGKMFVDPKGTNAFSALYEHIDLLDNINVNDEDFIKFKNTMSKKTVVRQADFGKDSIVDYLLFALNKIYFTKYLKDYKNIINYLYQYFLKFKNKFLIKSQKKRCNNCEINLKKPYILLPLQVSADSQLLYHSDYNIIDAIIFAKELCTKEKCNLIIKTHPAERNEKVINKIVELKEKFGYEIVETDIKQLIKYAEKVCVINSTAGLEALLLDKKVVFIGRSFYSKLDSQKLKKYILGYLIDIDYFSDEKISQDIVKKCILRARILNYKRKA